MKKFVALLTREKRKSGWEKDDSEILGTLYIGYKKIRTIPFPYLFVNLFKERYTKSVRSYKHWNKSIS